MGSGTYIMRHIRDMNSHFDVPVFQNFNRYSIIKILCIYWINRHGEHIPEIFSPADLFFIEIVFHRCDLFFHLLRENFTKTLFGQYHLHSYFMQIVFGDDLFDMTYRTLPVVGRPAIYLDDDSVTIPGIHYIFVMNVYVKIHPVVKWNHKSKVGTRLIFSDEMGCVSFNDSGDFSRILTFVFIQYLYFYPIVVQCI